MNLSASRLSLPVAVSFLEKYNMIVQWSQRERHLKWQNTATLTSENGFVKIGFNRSTYDPK